MMQNDKVFFMQKDKWNPHDFQWHYLVFSYVHKTTLARKSLAIYLIRLVSNYI